MRLSVSWMILMMLLQVVLMMLLATNYIPVVVNHLLMAFYTAKVPFTCKVPAGGGNRSLYIPLVGNSSISDAEDYRGYESCLQYRDPADHETGTQVCRQGYDFQFEGE